MKSEGSNSEGAVRLSFSRSEALVLFELLSRFSNQKSMQIVDQAEERVLWDMPAELERLLVDPLSKDYEGHLQKARAEVRDESQV
jgi:hypothetical protein